MTTMNGCAECGHIWDDVNDTNTCPICKPATRDNCHRCRFAHGPSCDFLTLDAPEDKFEAVDEWIIANCADDGMPPVETATACPAFEAGGEGV